MSRTRFYIRFSAAFFSVVTAVTTSAWGQGAADLAARHELMQQASQADESGDHDRALDLSSRALQIQATPSLERFVAEQMAATGRLADSLGMALRCVTEAGHQPASANRDAVLQGCNAIVNHLRSEVGNVVVQTPSPAPDGLVIHVAEHELNQAFWGVAYVVTPGNVVIEATAPGFDPLRQEVNVAAGATQTVQLSLQRSAPSTQAAASASPAPVVVTESPPAAHGRRFSVIGPIVAGGGVAVLAASAVVAIVASNSFARLQSLCSSSDGCTQADIDSRRGGIQTMGYVATAGFAVGGAAIVAGAVLFFVLHPDQDERPSRARLTVDPTNGTVGVAGVF